MKLLEKLNLTQKQALDLISNMEELCELLAEAVTETKESPIQQNQQQRFHLTSTLQTTAAQLKHAAQNHLKHP